MHCILARNRDILLHCITHNVMILRRQRGGFLQSIPDTLFAPSL